MPLLIPTAELVPGMKLCEAIISDGRIMMQGGRELTSRDISAMRRRYPRMRVRVGDPVLDSIVEFEDDSRDRLVADECQRQVAKCMESVHERFADRTSVVNVQIGALQKTVRDLMDLIRANPVSNALVSACMDADGYLRIHAGNVFYLSMLLAYRRLDYVINERRRQTRIRGVRRNFAMDLVPLGLGAMIMDIGLAPVQSLLRPDCRLRPEESERFRTHPMEGKRLLPEATSALTRLVVRSHHENYAGGGYPRHRDPRKVHVFTRIARIADAYDAATSVGVFTGARSPARILWEMSRGPTQGFYDPKLMEVFATLVQPFPIGSKLRLSDGRYGAVVRYNRNDPFDPVIIVCFDENNERLAQDRLDGPFQPSARNLRIAAHGDEDLSYIYTTQPTNTNLDWETFENPLQALYP